MSINPMVLYKPLSARRFVLPALLFVLILSGFAPLPQEPGGSVLDNILRIVSSFASLAGISALVTVLIAFARAGGIIKTDEQAGKATATVNLIAFGVLCYFGVFRPDLELSFLDTTAAQIASIALFVLGLYTQIIAVPPRVLRGAYQARVPVLGAVGADSEFRAHYVEGAELRSENWSTDPEDLRKKNQ